MTPTRDDRRSARRRPAATTTTAAVTAVLAALAATPASRAGGPTPGRPNVLLIVTDDQGYGDVGVHGNRVLKTPNIDRLARGGVRLTDFHACPVCAPTRASLMTGRYPYRTGVVDTYIGRAMMHPDEVTLAEILAAAGYRTGIFGKWHLGDNAPMRPIDQGFHEALVIKGGGIDQPSDPPGGSSYFNPVLQHNGRTVTRAGYCSDVFTDAAIEFLSADRDRPFFAYLAYNCPHTPLQVPSVYVEPYAGAEVIDGVSARPRSKGPSLREITAKVYGMVANIDENLGRLFDRLDALGVADRTLVLFLTDNGPQQARYNAGLRGLKATVYEGGTRVPCFVRWPGRLAAGKAVDRVAAVADLAPTLLEACGVATPRAVDFDGVSLWPLLTGAVGGDEWPDRTLFVQYHRAAVPEKFRAFAVRTQRYKLVRAEPAKGGPAPRPELFDMRTDPLEQFDISADRPGLVARLTSAYSSWFDDVTRTRGFETTRIDLGSPREDPTVLTRQDWRGPRAEWRADSLGYWDVEVVSAGTYDVTVEYAAGPSAGTLHLALKGATREEPVGPGGGTREFKGVRLTPGPGRLETWVERGGDTVGARSVEVRRRE
jgi:arylsulfatase A-like enzyme